MGLRIYVDFMSQPSRALLIFARANKIEYDEKLVAIRDMGHKQPEFLAINPMGQLPAIDDDGFKLAESHAILRYLCATRSVADHWYPADPKQRARIDYMLDWHHLNLRQGSSKTVLHKVLGKSLGMRQDEQIAKESEKVLSTSLKFMEDNWLTGENPFLDGASQPSIADLAMVCELKQLDFLQRSERQGILQPWDKIRKWIHSTEETLAPHFTDVHSLLTMVSEKIQAKRDREQKRALL